MGPFPNTLILAAAMAVFFPIAAFADGGDNDIVPPEPQPLLQEGPRKAPPEDWQRRPTAPPAAPPGRDEVRELRSELLQTRQERRRLERAEDFDRGGGEALRERRLREADARERRLRHDLNHAR